MVTCQLELRKMSPIPICFGGEVMMNSEFIEGLELDLYPTLNSSRYMLVEYNVLRDIHSIDYRDECLYEFKDERFCSCTGSYWKDISMMVLIIQSLIVG